jgi:2-hydroxychromene-2-carboxylate isomerase
MSTPITIDCWFDFASTYSYLSVLRIEAAAAPLGVQVAWRPLLLGPILRDQGWAASPFQDKPARARYMWGHDLPRQCAKYGLPVVDRQPSVFPRSAVLPLRVALLGADQQAPWVGEFCRRIMLLNFVADRDIEPVDTVAEVLTAMGLPAAGLVGAAQTDTHKQRLRDQTAQAAALGVFGAPTFFVGEAMYWGNDRLDDALAHAASLRHRGGL